MDTIRVLLVDDHPLVCRGLRSLLSFYQDIDVIGDATDGMAAIRKAIDLHPDIILLDIKLPGIDGVEIAHRLHRQAPSAKVIILSAYDNEEYVLGAFQGGVYAYILKSLADETVVDAIRSVYQGRRMLSIPLMDKVLKRFQTLVDSNARQESGLCEQDLGVLTLLARGASNREISEEMYWSERTTKRKVQEIIMRLGVRNRAQAVSEAIKKGLI